MTSYQKLKKENAELRDKLFKVCINPGSLESMMIVGEQINLFQMERTLWTGGENLDGAKFEGLLKHIFNAS